MRKVSLVLAYAAFGAVALAGTDTFSTASANTFGALKITSNVAGAENFTYVAVPFEEFADAVDEATGKHPDNKRLISGAIVPGLCKPAATMSVYEPVDSIWWGYSAYTSKRGIDLWSPSQVTQGDGGTTIDSPDSEDTYMDVGTGVFWNPGQAVADGSNAIYSYGQMPADTTKAVTLPAVKALVCPPGAAALKAFNLNTAEWKGVTASTLTLSGTNVRRVASAGDMIQFKDPSSGTTKQLYYATVPGGTEKKWGSVSIMKPFDVNAAVIPAGTAFWYVPKGSASVTWQ